MELSLSALLGLPRRWLFVVGLAAACSAVVSLSLLGVVDLRPASLQAISIDSAVCSGTELELKVRNSYHESVPTGDVTVMLDGDFVRMRWGVDRVPIGSVVTGRFDGAVAYTIRTGEAAVRVIGPDGMTDKAVFSCGP